MLTINNVKTNYLLCLLTIALGSINNINAQNNQINNNGMVVQNIQNQGQNIQPVVANNQLQPNTVVTNTIDSKNLEEEYGKKLSDTKKVEKDSIDNIFKNILECESITVLIEQYANIMSYVKNKNDSDLSGYTFYKFATNKNKVEENINKLLAKELSKATTKHRTLSIQKKKIYNYELPLFASQIHQQLEVIASNNINNFFSSFDNFKKSFDETLAMSKVHSSRIKEKKLKFEVHNSLDVNYVLQYIANKNPYIEIILKSYLTRIMCNDSIDHYYDLYWIMARTGIVLEAIMKQHELPGLYNSFFEELKKMVQELDLVRLFPELENADMSMDDDDNPTYKAKFSGILRQCISGLYQTDNLMNIDLLMPEYIKSIMLLRSNNKVNVLDWVFPDFIAKFNLNNAFNYQMTQPS